MTHASRYLTLVCLVVAGTLGSGCGVVKGLVRPPAAVDSITGDSVPQFVELQVDNHNWSDVTVYLVRSGNRTRLGTVGTARSGEFRVPASYAATSRLSLLVTPIGSPTRFESERFSVQPGQRVIWTIESSLKRSSLMIR
jgi:hypothetical protein